MSTLSQSAAPRFTEARTDASPMEKYGGENLPVLIQLPDLSEADQGRQPATESLGTAVEETVTTGDRSSIRLADIETDTEAPAAPENGTEEPPAALPREPGLRQQRQQRRDRVTRRSEQIARLPGWLRGISQLAFAALLAGVLLAIIVTLKNWNAPARSDAKRPDGVPFVEAPTFDMAPAGGQDAFTAPAANGPTLGPPTFTGESPAREDTVFGNPGLNNMQPTHSPGPEYDVRGRSQPASYGEQNPPVNITPARPSATGHTASTIQYPTTGVEPVSRGGGMPGEQVGRGWSETLPLDPVRSAERPAPPTYNHQYNQHR